MARIRTIKPQFFHNEDVAALGFGDRLLFIGLWTQADRAGRLEDRPLRLKAQLFPYDDLDLDHALGRLVNANLITRYEGNGVKLIQINTFTKHQQPHQKEPLSEYPGLEPDQSGAGPVPASLIYGEQEGNGVRTPLTPQPSTALKERFSRFWSAYPRRVAKEAAWHVWQRLKPSEELTVAMIAAVRSQILSPQWQKDGGEYIPHPRTWLNQGRWEDQPINRGSISQGPRPSGGVPDADATRQMLAAREGPKAS